MLDAYYPWFQWCETTPLVKFIGAHETFFPGLEVFHLIGLTLLLATTLVLSLRLMGLMMVRIPVHELGRELAPYGSVGILLMLLTGPIMFMVTATRNFSNQSFWAKMILLVMALIFHFAVFRRVTMTERGSSSQSLRVGAATAAVVLWFGVAVAGRAIAFFG